MEEHLEEHVGELPLELRVVAARPLAHGVGELAGLLVEVSEQALVGLGALPLAAAARLGHDRDRPVDGPAAVDDLPSPSEGVGALRIGRRGQRRRFPAAVAWRAAPGAKRLLEQLDQGLRHVRLGGEPPGPRGEQPGGQPRLEVVVDEQYRHAPNDSPRSPAARGSCFSVGRVNSGSAQTTRRGVPLWTLVAIIIGSTVGAGVFSLPQNIASVAGPGAMFIGWVVSGVGMLSIAFVFHILARRKPHLDSGVYAYVRAGLGDFIGFASGWGYWLGSVIAQVGYATLFFSTVGYYVPGLSGTNPLGLAIAASALTWVVFAVLAVGVRQAAILNAVTTIAKVVPILAFIVLTAFLGFSWETFADDFWGLEADSVGGVFDQVQGIMLFTVWVFIGIEGASVYSRQARSRRDVSRATVIGFLSVLGLLVAVSTLSFGVLSQDELAALPDNSMASVLEAVVGPWGGALVSAGLCISVLGAYVSWQMLCAEPIMLMASDGLLPKFLSKVNRRGSAWSAQLASTIVIQAIIVVFYFNETTYIQMVQLATVLYLVPYLFSALYLLLLAVRGRGLATQAGVDLRGPTIDAKDNRIHGLVGLLALVYSLWLFYAAEPRYVLFGCLAILPGLVPYVWTRRRRGEQVFNPFEWFVLALVVAAAAAGVWGLAAGTLTL